MSSLNTMKPTGGVDGRRVADRYDPNDHLMDLVMSQPNLQRAWKRVQDNDGAPGVDNMSVDQFAALARENWDKIRPSFWQEPINRCRSNGSRFPNLRAAYALWVSQTKFPIEILFSGGNKDQHRGTFR